MFGLFKKKTDNNIYAPVNGMCIDISEVKDEAFASKVLGDGFAVCPDGDVIASPCDGEITMIFPTNHAFGLKMDDDREILVHIGIDTVELDGEGFEALKEAGAKVKAGEEVVKIDKAFIEGKNYNLTTMVVITEPGNVEMKKVNLGKQVQCKELVIECK